MCLYNALFKFPKMTMSTWFILCFLLISFSFLSVLILFFSVFLLLCKFDSWCKIFLVLFCSLLQICLCAILSSCNLLALYNFVFVQFWPFPVFKLALRHSASNTLKLQIKNKPVLLLNLQWTFSLLLWKKKLLTSLGYKF